MELIVQQREILGKKVKTLRKNGLIPAELYGHGKENFHLSVAAKDFSKLYKTAGESTVINLVLDSEKIPALIHDVSKDSLADEFLNIDFYAVRMDEKIKTKAPLEFFGESPAVKKGGVLVKSMKEIEVEALPKDLPSHIEVDLSKLEEIHSNIYVRDLKISDKVKIFVGLETVVATIIEPVKEVVEEKPVSVEDVKVEAEEKKKAKEEEKEGAEI